MHFRAQRVAIPLRRFLGEFVERDDRQFEMLLLRVLHLVVTDAVQALHKHHDGGNAGVRDLGGVVQRAGWQPMRNGIAFGNRLIAERDEIGVKANPFDLPDSIP
jgi:hypothetical protein